MKRPVPVNSYKQQSTVSVEHIIDELRHRGSPKAISGLSRFGIRTEKALGVPVPQIRKLARNIGISHGLAQELWETGVHEARLLASMIDDPEKVTEDQMDKWASDFNAWDIVDQSCGNLFDRTQFAAKKAHEWSKRKEEYVKRAGFAMMAEMAVHDKKASDKTFLDFLPATVREASDERNFVKKAVNWAIRQIGKRNMILNAAAIKTCAEIQKSSSRSGKWIATDALRELTSASVKKKLANKKSYGSNS